MKLNLKIFVKVCLLGFLISCANDVEKNKQDKITEQSKKQAQPKKESEASLVREKAVSKLSVSDIDLVSIKKRFVNSNTSGKLSQKESKNYLSKKQTAFYGVYFFVQAESQLPFIGKAVVACQEQNGWDYSNELEELVEFSVFSNELNPFIETVRIGQTKKDVVKELGNDFKQTANNLIYSDATGNVVNVLITKDTVQAIKVGRYEKAQEVSPIKLKW